MNAITGFITPQAERYLEAMREIMLHLYERRQTCRPQLTGIRTVADRAKPFANFNLRAAMHSRAWRTERRVSLTS